MIWNRPQQDAQPGQAAHRDDADARSVPQPQIDSVARSFADAIPDPLLIVDATGRVIAANGPARQLFGKAVAGDHLSQHLRAPAILEATEQVAETGVARQVDFERRTGGGRRFEAWIAPLVLPAPGAVVSGAVVPAVSILLRDLTARQHLERMRTDFVANASHELRTPLASLTGFIETLQGPAREDPVARERFLGRMLEQAHRMKRLIDDLLSLSRVEMNVHRPPSDLVDLGDIARYAAEALGPVARKEDCQIRLDVPGPAMVAGDRDELIQVVQNLIENAIRYGASARGVDVTVSTNPARHRVSLSVRDYGPGIDPEHLPRLTERFYRVSEQESRSRGGTGLGLAIVKHIVLRHRAELDIKSARGEGSTFTIHLPMAEAVAKAAE